jgi:hypothetical protein
VDESENIGGIPAFEVFLTSNLRCAFLSLSRVAYYLDDRAGHTMVSFVV